jgi:hypothetical protein
MITPSSLVKAYERNTRIIEMQAGGLSHADSLIQTEYNINCLNWTIGHIVGYRDVSLELLGAAPVMGAAADRYARESDPIRQDGPGVVSLDELVAMARRSQDRLAETIGSASAEVFAEERTFGDRTSTVGSRMFFNYFHDTYHTGQTELLRQVAGMDDSII